MTDILICFDKNTLVVFNNPFLLWLKMVTFLADLLGERHCTRRMSFAYLYRTQTAYIYFSCHISFADFKEFTSGI
jgi:hypothetical protein